MTPAETEARTAFAGLVRLGGRLKLRDDGEVVIVWNGVRDDALADRLRAVVPELRAMLTA